MADLRRPLKRSTSLVLVFTIEQLLTTCAIAVGSFFASAAMCFTSTSVFFGADAGQLERQQRLGLLVAWSVCCSAMRACI